MTRKRRGQKILWVVITSALLLTACTGSAAQDEAARPTAATASVTPTTDGARAQVVEAQLACTNVPADERPNSAIFMASVCVEAVLDDEQRSCAASRAQEFSELPPPMDDGLSRFASLDVTAETPEEFVAVELADVIVAIPGVTRVVSSIISFETFVADEEGLRVGPSPSGGPLAAMNWTAIADSVVSSDAIAPGAGEFGVTQEVALDAGLEVGASYEVFTPSRQESFVYIGAFESDFEGVSMLAFSDQEALRFLADDQGYSAISIWYDDEAVVESVEQAVALSPGVQVGRPAETQAEQVASLTTLSRNSTAFIICTAPDARVALVARLAQRTVSLETADCLLTEHVRQPLDHTLFVSNTDC